MRPGFEVFKRGDELAPFWQIYPTAYLMFTTSRETIHEEEFKQRAQSHNLRPLLAFMLQ